jgi:hypothetical protein
MNKKCILVRDETDNTEIYYFKIIDVAKKYNFTPQHISNILRGITKHKFFIYKEKIVHLEYIECKDEQLQILKEKQNEMKKDRNKRSYEKVKLMRQLVK